MQEVTVANVWEAVEADRSFIRQIPAGSARDVWRAYLGELLPVLAPYVNEKVTVQSLLNTKLAYIKHAVASGFLPRLIHAYPEDALGGMTAIEVLDMVGKAMEMLIPQLEEIVASADTWLKQNGITEAEFMANPKFNLNKIAAKEYREGTLTIGGLLCLQPAAILKNTD